MDDNHPVSHTYQRMAISRRRFIGAAAAAGGTFAVWQALWQDRFSQAAEPSNWANVRQQSPPDEKRTELGICLHGLPVHMEASRRRGQPANLSDPLAMLEFCHTLGAGGIQTAIGIRQQQYCQQLRNRAEQLGMWTEGIVELPPDQSALERFEAQLRAAAETGAAVVRCVLLPGRRYEQFRSAEQFRQALQRAEKSLQLAEPVARKHRVRLAVENHKDLRSQELLAILQRLGSQQVGVCVDTGNSIALLEDPLETVEALAPLAAAVHLKDMDVREHPAGFLLAEVPLGEGILDMPRIVAVLRRANPQLRFSLEIITRDPLVVPCLGEQYMATLGDVPARDLARTLRLVRSRADGQPLPRISHLTLDEQLAAEKQNIGKCIQFASVRLKL